MLNFKFIFNSRAFVIKSRVNGSYFLNTTLDTKTRACAIKQLCESSHREGSVISPFFSEFTGEAVNFRRADGHVDRFQAMTFVNRRSNGELFKSNQFKCRCGGPNEEPSEVWKRGPSWVWKRNAKTASQSVNIRCRRQ